MAARCPSLGVSGEGIRGESPAQVGESAGSLRILQVLDVSKKLYLIKNYVLTRRNFLVVVGFGIGCLVVCHPHF